MPVQCLLDAAEKCGEAELGRGHPDLLFPQMEMKGCRLAPAEAG